MVTLYIGHDSRLIYIYSSFFDEDFASEIIMLFQEGQTLFRDDRPPKEDHPICCLTLWYTMLSKCQVY